MTVDKNRLHLFPDFRAKLDKVISEVEEATGHLWTIIEGFRSQARQTELYAQGRTKPGPIVTWMKSPRWHGTGLAADVAPLKEGTVWYECPRQFWEKLREIGKKHGLINPAWSKGDLGHLQDGELGIVVKAQTFITKGFKL